MDLPITDSRTAATQENGKKYFVSEVFYSLQGEGMRAGTANVFVRFGGCNLRCDGQQVGDAYQPVCDTEFASGRKLTLDEIRDWVVKAQLQALQLAGAEALTPPGGCRYLILTGGEPGLQVDEEFCYYFKDRGYRLAIETNGSIALPLKQDRGLSYTPSLELFAFDWITVSPKVAEHAIKQKFAHEVKYVRGYGQGIPKTVVEAEHYLISPAFDGGQVHPDVMKWCIRLCLENPQWRLSVQQHKQWQVR